MIILKHPIAADVVLVSTADAEHLAFISDECAAELRNEKVVEQYNLLARQFVDIVEVDVFGAPFEVVYILSGRVRLLQNESIVQQLAELLKDVDITVVADAAAQLTHLALFRNELLADRIKVAANCLIRIKEVLRVLIALV